MTHVKVIPANGFEISPGPNVDRAKLFGIRVELCGESCECCPDRQAWEGYIYSNPVLGESKDAYESAEDCADAALLLLAKALAFEFDSAVVKRDLLHRILSFFPQVGTAQKSCIAGIREIIGESLNPLNKTNG
jgi:hypothetical protein